MDCVTLLYVLNRILEEANILRHHLLFLLLPLASIFKGLKGHSDSNADGEVNVHELYDYVYSRVAQTAKVRFNSPQTPVRIIGSRVPGVPVVLKHRAENYCRFFIVA